MYGSVLRRSSFSTSSGVEVIEIPGIESLGEKNYHFWENEKKKYFNKLNYINQYKFKYAEEGYYPNYFFQGSILVFECEREENEDNSDQDEYGCYERRSDKNFEEKKIIYCPGCDKDMEMYYGICLNCGDDINMSSSINPDDPPKWMPNPKLDYEEKLKQIKKYLRFKERLKEEELKELEKEFEETIFIDCPSCDEVTEMYYGICLNCGDESEKEFAIDEYEPPKWMPESDLKGEEKAIAIREYLYEKKKKDK